ncbi:MAG: radical SAM family heme chaperone HemW [Acidaminococcaceae bacterium]|nr:radical SAM family heme chaperone HemW [Acidaminococcaceae bacterium]
MNKWEQIQGIYVHIPFCLQKCLYCDFASFAQKSDKTMAKYTDKICGEINQHISDMYINPQATIYFGGGTPSVLPIKYIEKIVAALKNKGLWQKPTEVTIEANPGTISAESLQAYRHMGFNRISFGIQSMQDSELKAMGRIHTAREALAAIEMARSAEFTHISVDLIYGYPGQTIKSVTNSLETIVKQGIKHLSVYGLVVEEDTPLQKKVETGELLLPGEDDSGDMYDFIEKYLIQQQYRRYEISNYALEGEESKHYLLYWQYLPYLGFGVSACSFNGKERKTNPYTIEGYLNEAEPLIEKLSPADTLAEYIFMGLRTSQGINLEIACKRFNVDIKKRYEQEIKECQSKGLLQVDAGETSFSLTEFGMKFGNQVFEKFL